MSNDMRSALDGAATLLRDAGIAFTEVRTAGQADDILVIGGDPSLALGLDDVTAGLKSLGFRYITVDLGFDEATDA